MLFRLSNGNELLLYFPSSGRCLLIPDAQGRPIAAASRFREHFNCPIGFVPILGPVEQVELLYEKEAARLALFNYRAARNFRNIWYHYPERFEAFRSALIQTWPGMDVEPPHITMRRSKPQLYMMCPEGRIPREIFWSGFGFQVWCQMLTHLIQSRTSALFLIDEPDIYLHADLQRQLLSLLRTLGPDILIATHSTEILMEAESDDIVLINKSRRHARRIRNPSQIEEVLKALGSNLNPILTQLAKTRRAVFVEGQDLQIIGKFARKMGAPGVANRSNFALIPVDGFNPQRIRSLKDGMDATLGGKISAAAILDRDYRCEGECKLVLTECEATCEIVVIHERKEIENFLLVPAAVDRAAERAVVERNRRSNAGLRFEACAAELLEQFAESKRAHVMSRLLASCRSFEKGRSAGVDETTITEIGIKEFERRWKSPSARLLAVSGKDALTFVNIQLQAKYKVSLSATSIIDAMIIDEVPSEMKVLIEKLTTFCVSRAR